MERAIQRNELRARLRAARSSGETTCDCRTLRIRLEELRNERLAIARLFGISPCYDDTPHSWSDGEHGNVSLVALLRSRAASSFGEPVSQEGPFIAEYELATISNFESLLEGSLGEEQVGVKLDDIDTIVSLLGRLRSALSGIPKTVCEEPMMCSRCSKPVITDLAAWMYDSDEELDEMCQCPARASSSGSPRLSEEEREILEFQVKDCELALQIAEADSDPSALEQIRRESRVIRGLIDRLSVASPEKGKDAEQCDAENWDGEYCVLDRGHAGDHSAARSPEGRHP